MQYFHLQTGVNIQMSFSREQTEQNISFAKHFPGFLGPRPICYLVYEPSGTDHQHGALYH